MRVAASNIAWPAALDGAAYRLMAAGGVRGIEVAPTRIWPDWQGISQRSVAALKREIAAEGLEISSLQAILFQKPELQLFSEGLAAIAFADHMRFCAELAAELGARAVVFGAPKNRDRGALSESEASDRAVEVFAPLADVFAAHSVELGLEPNPEQYGCNFVTRAADAARLVRRVGSSGLRLHLDTACAVLAEEDIAQLVCENADILAHFHASEPLLGALGAATEPHARAAQALREADYRGWVAIEMRAQENVEASLRTAADFAVGTYGEGA